jgi:hypothetical protein
MVRRTPVGVNVAVLRLPVRIQSRTPFAARPAGAPPALPTAAATLPFAASPAPKWTWT